jgi:hypothetical protein
MVGKNWRLKLFGMVVDSLPCWDGLRVAEATHARRATPQVSETTGIAPVVHPRIWDKLLSVVTGLIICNDLLGIEDIIWNLKALLQDFR